MKKKQTINRWLKTFAWLIPLTIFIVVLSALNGKENAQFCQGLVIDLHEDEGLFFLDSTDIKYLVHPGLLENNYHLSLEEINLNEIEGRLRENLYVRDAEIFMSKKNELHIDIIQRKPIVRVVDQIGESYYIDKTGMMIPLSENFTARVPVATINSNFRYEEGEYSDSLSAKLLYRFSKYIYNNPFWKAQTSQISMNNKNEFELTPLLGDFTVKLGSINQFEEKLKKMKGLYIEGIGRGENFVWNYESFDIKDPSTVFGANRKK